MDAAVGRRVKEAGASTVGWQKVASALSSLVPWRIVIVIASVDSALVLWLVFTVASS